MLARVVTSFMLLGLVSAGDYNYNRCDKTNGPSGWSGACQNKNSGTPINLCGAVSFTGTAPTLNVTGYSTSRNLLLFNTGSTIQVNMPDTNARIEAGTLSKTVGRGSSTTAITWILGQIHFHWGRTGKTDEGSEHYMQGNRYPFEAHFVHYNSAYSSVATAAGSGAADALLVVGVFVQTGSTDTQLLKGIASGVASSTKTATAMSTALPINELFDASGNFYSYGGGLTTPTCSEIVTWIVMTDVKTMTTDTLNLYKAATTSPSTSTQKFMALQTGTQGYYGNYRPLQGVGNRTVYIKSGTSAACSTPTEPTFVCSAGFMASPSFLFHSVVAAVALFLARL